MLYFNVIIESFGSFHFSSLTEEKMERIVTLAERNPFRRITIICVGNQPDDVVPF